MSQGVCDKAGDAALKLHLVCAPQEIQGPLVRETWLSGGQRWGSEVLSHPR